MFHVALTLYIHTLSSWLAAAVTGMQLLLLLLADALEVSDIDRH